MAGPNTLNFDDGNFESDVLNADVPVLVDFWAQWCAPCQMLGPTIDDLATEYEGKVKVGKLDVDSAPNVTAKYGVQQIPTVILFQNGEPVERMVGAKNKREYKAVLDSKIAAG